MPETEKTPINLVLGSGGARGLTHIGAVRVLQEHGYEIRSITGCSMGALVGALLVTGHLDEYEEWVCQLTRWDVLRFLDISLLGRAGMVKGDKLMERLSDWLDGVDMAALPIPLTVVAADIAARKEVWISSGDLLEAVRASIAVPGVFTPLVKHGRVLVDGGILNPLPIPPARLDNSLITVAVSLSGREVNHPYGPPPVPENPPGPAGESERFETSAAELSPYEDPVDPQSEEPEAHAPIDGFLDSLQRFFGRENRDQNGGDKTPEAARSDKGSEANRNGDPRAVDSWSTRLGGRPALTDVMLGMFLTMQDTLARHQLAGNPPDILIDIPCNICESHEFHLAAELIPAGAYWARRALDEQRVLETH